MNGRLYAESFKQNIVTLGSEDITHINDELEEKEYFRVKVTNEDYLVSHIHLLILLCNLLYLW